MTTPNFEIKGEIATGAQGTVISAVDSKTHKNFAIKVFNLQNPNGSRSFSHETAVIKHLKTKNVKKLCSIKGMSMNDNFGFIFMKQYSYDLFSLIFDSDDQLDEKAIKKYFKQVCKAVAEMHKVGVAHLDLKPENVLIDKKGEACVCDFGCAYVSERKRTIFHKSPKHKQVGGLKGRGTKLYAAPEVFSKAVNMYNPFLADIYSLGVILHVLMTGVFPIKNNLELSREKLPAICYSLLASILRVNPEERPSISQILSHKWFKC